MVGDPDKDPNLQKDLRSDPDTQERKDRVLDLSIIDRKISNGQHTSFSRLNLDLRGVFEAEIVLRA